MEVDHNLDKVKMIRQQEVVHEQQTILKSSPGDRAIVQAVAGSCQLRGYGQQQQRARQPAIGSQGTQHKVWKSHAQKSCPVMDASCWKCGKRGYYARVCRNKAVSALEEAVILSRQHT